MTQTEKNKGGRPRVDRRNVTHTLPPAVIEQISREAQARGMTKSALLELAIKKLQ